MRRSHRPPGRGDVTFDDGASPWHTVCEVESPDKPGLLHALANAFAAAGVEVHSARISSEDGVARDRFDLTDRDGRKLDGGDQGVGQRFIAGGVVTKKRRFRRICLRGDSSLAGLLGDLGAPAAGRLGSRYRCDRGDRRRRARRRADSRSGC